MFRNGEASGGNLFSNGLKKVGEKVDFTFLATVLQVCDCFRVTKKTAKFSIIRNKFY